MTHFETARHRLFAEMFRRKADGLSTTMAGLDVAVSDDGRDGIVLLELDDGETLSAVFNFPVPADPETFNAQPYVAMFLEQFTRAQ